MVYKDSGNIFSASSISFAREINKENFFFFFRNVFQTLGSRNIEIKSSYHQQKYKFWLKGWISTKGTVSKWDYTNAIGRKKFFFYLFCLFCSTYSFINKRREKKTLSNFCLLQCNKIKNKKKKKEEKILVFSRNSFSLRTSSRLFTPGKLTRLLLLYFTWWRLIFFFLSFFASY